MGSSPICITNFKLKTYLYGNIYSYSDADVRNIALEMTNEAVTGLRGEPRWDMQKRLGKIKDKWKLQL